MIVRETSSGFPRSSPEARAAWLREVGGAEAAAASGQLSEVVELPLVEALLIGLMRQGVTKYLAVFGHGSTALAEMLRIYESHGLVRCWQFRNEVEMAHAATALSWVYGEVPAVVTDFAGRGTTVVERQHPRRDPFGVKPVADGVGADRRDENIGGVDRLAPAKRQRGIRGRAGQCEQQPENLRQYPFHAG